MKGGRRRRGGNVVSSFVGSMSSGNYTFYAKLYSSKPDSSELEGNDDSEK